MSPILTLEQILALAPDASAAKAGKDLAAKSKWKSLAKATDNDVAVWGECQGSGSSPYQVRADLSAPAFKCSCPSRKFPCKHSLALGILYATNPDYFAGSQMPSWVSDWMQSRETRRKRSENQDSDKTPEQLEEARQAKEKRQQDRLSRIQAGVGELELFTMDLMRQGIGSVKKEPYSYWQSRAARLVDAQAPGLARMVNDLAEVTGRAVGWEDALIDKLATINLLNRAFHKIDSLSPDLRTDVLTAIGVNQSQEELLAGPSEIDDWLVLAQYTYNEDKLRVQRNWLRSSNGKYALVLSFAHGTAPFDIMFMPGNSYRAELVFYKGTLKQRALVKSKETIAGNLDSLQGTTVAQALDNYSLALSATPWLNTMPFFLGDVIPYRVRAGEWWLIDSEKEGLSLSAKESVGWQLLSYCGGTPISVFGEWDGTTLKPLAAVKDKRYLRLHFQEL